MGRGPIGGMRSFIILFGLILVGNDSSHDFFARSPQNLTVLAPFMVLKQSNFGENVQKSRVTSHFPLISVRNIKIFHEIVFTKPHTAQVNLDFPPVALVMSPKIRGTTLSFS